MSSESQKPTNHELHRASEIPFASQDTAPKVRQLLNESSQNEDLEKKQAVQREFIQMQIAFAHRAAHVCRDPFKKSLLTYTLLYSKLGLVTDANQELDDENPQWKEFLSHIDSDEELCNAALNTIGKLTPQEKKGRCFSYNYDAQNQAIHIHFANNDSSEKGPLSDERLEVRTAELRSLFSEIHEKFPEAKNVQGSSWLYNVPNYRKLFPPTYTEGMGTPRCNVTSKSIWGQFYNREGGLRSDRVQEFLNKVEKAEDEEQLLDSFPLRERSAGCRIEDFYSFYGFA